MPFNFFLKKIVHIFVNPKITLENPFSSVRKPLDKLLIFKNI
jgi:hypothetical protein